MVDFSEIKLGGDSSNKQDLATQPALRAAQLLIGSPVIEAIRHIRETGLLGNNVALAEQLRALTRSALGPMEDLRLAGAFEKIHPLYSQLVPAKDVLEAFNARFTLPKNDALTQLSNQLHFNPLKQVIQQHAAQMEDMRKALFALQKPWLDAENSLRSLTAFAEIQGMGAMLTRLPSFDSAVSDALRIDLGDWRDEITWTEPVKTDLHARGEFYVGLGFNPALTDFPVSAFQESTQIAGLRRGPPPLIDLYGEPVPRENDIEAEDALLRTNMAHNWLLRLETNLRRFIDAKMTAVFGADWPRHQLPNGLFDKWAEKRDKALKAGGQYRPLIAYADFTDYVLVICKADNWRQVFAIWFGRTEDVRESFQRLHPIRLDTMHARPIGQDDELLLYVEVKRLVKAIMV